MAACSGLFSDAFAVMVAFGDVAIMITFLLEREKNV